MEASFPALTGRVASSSEDQAAEFHEPLIGAPIREEDDRVWPGPAGDLSNEYGTSRVSDRGHDDPGVSGVGD